MSSKNKSIGEMSPRRAERILEIFENGSKNGEEWAHDVVLRRGTNKYQESIDNLNEALRVKSIHRIIAPLSIQPKAEQKDRLPKGEGVKCESITPAIKRNAKKQKESIKQRSERTG